MAKGKSAGWLTEEGLLQIKGMARDGYSDKDIFESIGISKQTFYDWEKRFPTFLDAIKKGREPVKIKVEDAFYSRCEWKEVTETKREVFIGKDGKETKKVTTQTRWIPPEPSTLIFALKNLDPKKWRDKRDLAIQPQKQEDDALSKSLKELAKELKSDD